MQINLGLILLSYIYNIERSSYATRSFDSLSRTLLQSKSALYFVIKPSTFNYDRARKLLSDTFNLTSFNDSDLGVTGIDQTFIQSAKLLLTNNTDITHVYLLVDDFIYNPQWYNQLVALIQRNPDGIAWTPYKSANIVHHKILRDTQFGDKVVTSVSGTGAISREEFLTYAPDRLSDFSVPPANGGGCTLDLHHAYTRQGIRYATNLDYIDHIGIEGINCRPGTPEHATNFVGE